jgi:hypothetical protein
MTRYMTAENKFELSWREKLEEFRTFKVAHNRLLQVTAAIKRAMIYRGGEGFILLVGATRTGKTTTLTLLENSIIRECMAEMLKDPGFLPVAGIEAGCKSRFDWRDHWFGCLEALKEPAIAYKSANAEPLLDQAELEHYYNSSTKSEATLCRSFINAAVKRRLRMFFIDEAQHLTFVQSAKKLRPQLETIKSVANRSGVMHVLCGHFDLLKLRNASGQLGSRAVTIHFSRYRPDRQEDLKSFADALLSLAAYMRLPEPPDMEKDLDYCFERSLGCIGLLKVWLTDALGSVLESGRSTLTRRDLELHEPPVDVLDQISEEIIKGESMLEQDKTLLQRVRLRLLQKPEAMAQKPNSQYLEDIPKEKTVESLAEAFGKTEAKKSRARKASRIERKPKRDKVNGGRKKRAA